ncbi:MAG TPA: SufS family cysteine desulfurase [Phycisphaerales bacterium]|nr:SufS family cysteine desulfurase [Phycisphaerales bacterium]HRQ75610.1 SufS family cysteine desulfurase [Phycisphaerales bacterium]
MSTIAAKTQQGGQQALDVHRLREEFPALHQSVNGKPLVYLDSAATTQKPRCVLEAMDRFYERDNANVHRGVHTLSQRATDAFERSRITIARFLNASDANEIVFTRGATEAINLVASSYGVAHLHSGDEVLISTMEHHSNIVPWQLVCEQTGASLKVIPITDDGEIALDAYEQLLSEKTKIISVVHVSNALGTINPIRQMVAIARKRAPAAVFVVDGAQATSHMKVDVRDLDVDFYAVSAHKMYGPTGIGALFGRKELLDAMPPYQGGGDMIKSVSFEKTIYNDVPFRFEAGTPNIAGAIGFAAAAEFLNRVGVEGIGAHEHQLLQEGIAMLDQIPGLRLIGRAKDRAGVMSFVLDGIDAYTAAVQLDQEGIAVRVGHHCTEPLMKRFGLNATMRATLGAYSTREEVEALVNGLLKVRRMSEIHKLSGEIVRYRKVIPASNTLELDRIIETFEFFDEWEERYAYLLDLEKRLLPMREEDKTEENFVHGCQSQVWMKVWTEASARDGGSERILRVIARSDAAIVNGLIAILLAAYDGKPVREAVAFDAPALFKRLGLLEHLSPTRRNGLHSMVARVRELAAKHAK